MALYFPKFSWLWLNGKEKEQVPNGSLINPMGDLGLGVREEAESLRFHSVKEVDRGVPSSSSLKRKVKKKWKSREERSIRIDREYDVVLVPSDGVGLSGSESDGPDWSIGWLEPHAPDFQSDDEADDDSFAVLVPCYRRDLKKVKDEEAASSDRFLNANVPVDYYSDGPKYMKQWLSSLHNF